MAKKKKGRAAKSAKAKSAVESEELSRAPHTFVIKRGSVGRNVNNLMADMRKVMEPYTASQLKVGKQNVLKDFVAIAGPLHVSHMVVFSKSDVAPHLRIMRLPRGPTLTFRVEKYSLMRDVVSSLKKPQNHPKQYDHPPLLVLNNFKDEKMENRLTTTMLQSMYPSLNVTKLKLNQVRRCVLFNYIAETDRIEFRHYNVRATPHGMSRAVKKLVRGKIPDMSRHQDISDYLTQGGEVSEQSEGEDDPDNKVNLPQAISSRGNMANQLSSIRLTELGPRMTLELVKIEEEICSGEVMFHKYIHKTEDEIKDLRRARILRQTRKADLRQQQEQNVERKQEKLVDHRENCRQGTKRRFGAVDGPEVDEDDDGYVEKERVSDDDDEAWYEEEVGERPEPGMLSRGGFGFRRGGMRGRGRGRFSSRGGFGRGRGGGGGSFRSGNDDFSERSHRGRSSDRGGYNRGSFGDRGSSRGGFRGRGDGGSSRGGRGGFSRGSSGRGFGGSGRGGGDSRGGRGMHKAISFRKKSSFSR